MSHKPDNKDEQTSLSLSPMEAAVAARLIGKLAKLNGPATTPENIRLYELACRLYGARRERRHAFPDDLFGEPVWDMLLVLYCSEGRREEMSVSGLSYSSGVPITTALRWISEIERRELVFRSPHRNDKRSIIISLTELGREKMDACLQRLSERYFNLD